MNVIKISLILIILFSDSYQKLTNNYLNTIILTGTYSKELDIDVNKTTEYIIVYHDESLNDPFNSPIRVSVSTDDPDSNEFNPILVVVREKQSVLSWQVPLILVTHDGISTKYFNTSRTLCPADHKENNQTSERIVSISTASKNNITAKIYVEHLKDVIIVDNVEREIEVTPSQPKYYYYQFLNKSTDDAHNYHTVILQATSSNNLCMVISIQHPTCPVYDLEKDITFDGYRETMTKKGGITLSQTQFPNGFYIVFVVKSDDYACQDQNNTNFIDSEQVFRNKDIKFKITSSISYNDYEIAILFTLCVVLSFYFIFVLVLCYCARIHKFRPLNLTSLIIDQENLQEVNVVEEGPSEIKHEFLNRRKKSIEDSSSDESFSEYDALPEVNLDKDLIRTKLKLTVADLSKKRLIVQRHHANMYLWNVIIVAIFYGLPVIQLVIRYQSVLNETGDQDLCYYNFLCAHPLGFLSDFNHVFSNIGYISLGILFVFLVYRRAKMHQDQVYDQQIGIPQHYGIFYALGVSLIMEGVVSGSYHVCPNHYNFQFDSSFMYVMTVLTMIKIYQSRHPDVNIRSHWAFCILAITIFLGMVGILNGSFYFWIFFTILHIITCLVLSLQIYYMGRFKLNLGIFKRVFNACRNDYYSGSCNLLKPQYKGRLFLLFIINILNWVLAYYGLVQQDRSNFGSYVLFILMGNGLLYMTFYILMKLFHSEHLQKHAVTYLILAILFWVASAYFFSEKSNNNMLTPAESRLYNQACLKLKMIKFYDNHDIWHFLSAIALFFSFMLLLSLDDDLAYTPRNKIPVF